MKYPREAKEQLWNIGVWVAQEPTPTDRLCASHSDVVNDIRFVTAAILDFLPSGLRIMLQ